MEGVVCLEGCKLSEGWVIVLDHLVNELCGIEYETVMLDFDGSNLVLEEGEVVCGGREGLAADY